VDDLEAIKKVCENVGIKDNFHFYRLYKNNTEYTPKNTFERGQRKFVVFDNSNNIIRINVFIDGKPIEGDYDVSFTCKTIKIYGFYGSLPERFNGAPHVDLSINTTDSLLFEVNWSAYGKRAKCIYVSNIRPELVSILRKKLQDFES
jgi:hypothetical protein